MEALAETNENLILPNNYVEYFEQNISHDDTVIMFKVNDVDLEDEDRHNILLYLKDYVIHGLNETIKFSSAGLHVGGKNKIPHFHYHFICEAINQAPQNPSDHRKRYVKKRLKDNPDYHLNNVSMKYKNFITKNMPKYHILAYPLKENGMIEGITKSIYIDRGEPMAMDKIQFLMAVGKTIYENALASHHRNDLCEERKKNKLLELQEIVKNQFFKNFRDMVIWLDENYINNLEVHELPDFRNYKSNCEKVAVKLGILRYSQLF